MRGAIGITVCGLVAACSLPEVDLRGKGCPCAVGWVCDTSRNECVLRGPEVEDGGHDGGEPPDGGLDASTRDAGREPDAGPGEWSAPRRIEAIAGDAADDDPSLTFDGLALFFGSERVGGEELLHVTRRASVADPWGAPTAHGELGVGTTWWVTPDAGAVYFSRLADVYRAEWDPVAGVFGTAEAVEEVNDPTYHDDAAREFDGGRLLLFTTYRVGGIADIWMAERSSPDDPWGTPRPLPGAVNTSAAEAACWLSSDGLTLWFESDRPGGLGDVDIWVSTRPTVDDLFGPASNVTVLNSEGNDGDVILSYDERHVVFSSTRLGHSQLFEATR